jgi:ATP-dependent Clp protease adaptor protein ClpS
VAPKHNPAQPGHEDGDTGVVTETRTRPKLKKPPLFKVLLHNDNYTTRDFVVAVLREVFHKSETDAVQIMLHVHHHGIGVAGVYTYEVAETKIRQTEKLARDHEFPLRVSMEPEDED